VCYGKSVRLSVTLRYCVKMRESRGMRVSPLGSPMSLVFRCQEWLTGDDTVQVKFEYKEVDSCGNSRAVHIKMYIRAKNEVSRSRLSKVRA